MSWLSSDVNLVETDIAELRRHVEWLLEDLRAHQSALSGQGVHTEVLATQLDDHLARLGHLDTLLGQVREALE